jgi:hypothetical protein
MKWITRSHVHVDRVASVAHPRFIDSGPVCCPAN